MAKLTKAPMDRHADLLKQGFMRPLKERRPKAELETVACDACLNWHRKGKHTASPEARKVNLAKRKAGRLALTASEEKS